MASTQQQQKNSRGFKQTFIRYNLFVSRRDYDFKWEVVKKITDPRFIYDDKIWKGPRTGKGKIIKPMAWVTLFVFNRRQEAIDKAKQISG